MAKIDKNKIVSADIRKCKLREFNQCVIDFKIGGILVGSDSFGYIEKEDDKLFEENVCLYVLGDGKYTKIGNLKTLLSRLALYKQLENGIIGDKILDDDWMSGTYVDGQTKRSYYGEEASGQVSVHKLVKELENSQYSF